MRWGSRRRPPSGWRERTASLHGSRIEVEAITEFSISAAFEDARIIGRLPHAARTHQCRAAKQPRRIACSPELQDLERPIPRARELTPVLVDLGTPLQAPSHALNHGVVRVEPRNACRILLERGDHGGMQRINLRAERRLRWFRRAT